MGIYPEVRQKVSPVKNGDAPGGKIFSDEHFDIPALKERDLLIHIDTEEIIGSNFILRDFDFDVSIRDGVLRIGPANLQYTGGFMSIESMLDTGKAPPEFMLKLTAEDVDLFDLSPYTQDPLIRGGHLNLAVDLRSAGHSPREVASALDGEFGMAVEHGEIKKVADLLGADAIDYLATVRELGTYEKLNCLALQFVFEDGIGKSQVMYLDTPDVRSRGAGTINLRDESLEFVIQPKPKKGQIGGSSAVTLEGPMNRPSAKKLPFIESARLFGEIFMPYAFLPARAAGYVRYLMTEDKDEDSPCLKDDAPEPKEEPEPKEGGKDNY
jgi:uncharacterized protein involved in outer membrane biogenesis